MEYIIKDKNLSKNKILVSLENMKNTETRCRVKFEELLLCNITKSGKILSWQNSHFHKNCKELYLVKQGKMLLVTNENGNISRVVLSEGEISIIKRNVSHNVYLYEDTVICTLKYGGDEKEDWYEDNRLDEMCKGVDVESNKGFTQLVNDVRK